MSAVKLFVGETGGAYRAASHLEVAEAARAMAGKLLKRGTALESPRAAQAYLQASLGSLPHECFTILWLDNRHRLIKAQELFRGTLDGATVHPREVVKEALAHNAAACILSHNHPSGVPDPSQADELITRRLKESLALVDVRVLDHLIVAGDQVVSFAERGLL